MVECLGVAVRNKKKAEAGAPPLALRMFVYLQVKQLHENKNNFGRLEKIL